MLVKQERGCLIILNEKIESKKYNHVKILILESKLCHWLREKPHREFFPYNDNISLSDIGFLLKFIYCDLSFMYAWNLALDDKIWIKIVSFGFNQDITDFSWYWLR